MSCFVASLYHILPIYPIDRKKHLSENSGNKKMPVCETGIFKHPLPPSIFEGEFYFLPSIFDS